MRKTGAEEEVWGLESYLAPGLQNRKTEDFCCFPTKEVILGERVREKREIKTKEEGEFMLKERRTNLGAKRTPLQWVSHPKPHSMNEFLLLVGEGSGHVLYPDQCDVLLSCMETLRGIGSPEPRWGHEHAHLPESELILRGPIQQNFLQSCKKPISTMTYIVATQ